MPELPEVQIVVNGLKNKIIKQKIIGVKVSNRSLRQKVNSNFEKDILGCKIKNISRRSKYIIIDLDNGKSMLIHLGMSGRLTLENIESENELKKHSHVWIQLDNGSSLVYNDARRFGLVLTMNKEEIERSPFINHLGIEPLSEEFTGKKMQELFSMKNTPIKTTLLNQDLICGIGNIYACESLFYSRIHPLRKANSLTKKECEKLTAELKRILQLSIESGGSTLKDYRHSDGTKGDFQNSFSVYGRDGQDCFVCGHKIEKIKQGGRSTFFCPVCQKISDKS